MHRCGAKIKEVRKKARKAKEKRARKREYGSERTVG